MERWQSGLARFAQGLFADAGAGDVAVVASDTAVLDEAALDLLAVAGLSQLMARHWGQLRFG